MSNGGDSDKILYALSYPIWIVALILVLAKKESRDARYHGFNGLFYGLAVTILAMFIGMMPIIQLLSPLVGLAGIIYGIVLGVEAYNGGHPNIPVVTEFASKYVEGQ